MLRSHADDMRSMARPPFPSYKTGHACVLDASPVRNVPPPPPGESISSSGPGIFLGLAWAEEGRGAT